MTSELLNLITLLFVVFLVHKVSVLEKYIKQSEKTNLPTLSETDKNLIKANKDKAVRELMTKYGVCFDDARTMVNSYVEK